MHHDRVRKELTKNHAAQPQTVTMHADSDRSFCEQPHTQCLQERTVYPLTNVFTMTSRKKAFNLQAFNCQLITELPWRGTLYTFYRSDRAKHLPRKKPDALLLAQEPTS